MADQVLVCRSNPIAPDPRVERTAQALTRAGYGLRVVGWDRARGMHFDEQISGASVVRLPIEAQFGTGMGNFWPLLRWQWGLLRWMVRHRDDFEIVHACDFDTVLPAMICKSLFGKKVIYDIFDFYADHLRQTPGWIKRIIRAADLWLIRRVDGVIVTDEARLRQIDDLPADRCTIIYNTPQDVSRNVENQVPRQTTDQLKLVYVGLLQIERGLLDILNILKNHSKWQLDLAGFGGDKHQILKVAQELPNVHWHGRIPYHQTLALTGSADVVLALYNPAIPNHRFASPNKLFEAMMLGKPVVVAENTRIDKIVKREECGLVVEYGDQADLEKALHKLHADIAMREILGANGRNLYETKYNWAAMEKRLLTLYTRIFQSPISII